VSFFAYAIPNVTQNLEDLQEDYVIEAQKIDIPGFPYAFNPSMIRYNGAILMSVRLGAYPTCLDTEEDLPCRIPKNRVTTEVGLVLLDEDFNVISPLQVLDIPHLNPNITFYPQDPRLISIDHRIYAVYNNYVMIDSDPVNRMHFAELYFDGKRFVLGEPVCITKFDQCPMKKTEKNWAPFEYQGQLCFEYSIFPHKVFHADRTGHCKTVGFTEGLIKWDWGQLRGGSPAIRLGEEYLGFFHCSTALKTQHSKGKKITHYFMGAYTFAPEPPFAITAISSKPIIGQGFYEPQNYNTWKPLLGAFPSGYIFDDKFIWVSFGKQDHEVWVVKLDRAKLLNSLVSVSNGN
jgi:predicted GH43/DUF377 family glycosyl hydrolase